MGIQELSITTYLNLQIPDIIVHISIVVSKKAKYLHPFTVQFGI